MKINFVPKKKQKKKSRTVYHLLVLFLVDAKFSRLVFFARPKYIYRVCEKFTALFKTLFSYDSILLMLDLVCTFPFKVAHTFVAINLSFIFYCIAHCTLWMRCVRCTMQSIDFPTFIPSRAIHWMQNLNQPFGIFFFSFLAFIQNERNNEC